MGGLLSRVKPRTGTKGPFVPGRRSTQDKSPPYISSPCPLFQHLATFAPSILLAAVIPSSAPPRPRAPHRRPESSAPPPRDPAAPRQDPETATVSWPRPLSGGRPHPVRRRRPPRAPPGGLPRPVLRRRPPRAPPGGLPHPEDRLPERRAQRIDALRGLIVPDLRLARALPPSPAVAAPVRRRDLAAVREHAGCGPPPPRPQTLHFL
jgi:hypothetical protein